MFAVKVLCTLALVSLTLAYRAPPPKRDGYRQPSIHRLPPPTTYSGRNHGRSSVNHGKFKRSAEDDVVAAEGQAFLTYEQELLSNQAIRIPRSVDGLELVGEFQEAEAIPELSRVKRRFIYPTYKPPPPTRPTYRF